MYIKTQTKKRVSVTGNVVAGHISLSASLAWTCLCYSPMDSSLGKHPLRFSRYLHRHGMDMHVHVHTAHYCNQPTCSTHV